MKVWHFAMDRQDPHISPAFVVGYFSDLGSANAKAFLKIASSNDGQIFTITSSDNIKAKLGLEGDAVVVLKTFDELRNDLSIAGDLDVEATTQFIIGSCTPLIQTFSDQTSRTIFSSPIKVHTLFFTSSEEDHHESTMSVMTEVAKEFKGNMLFVNVPVTESRVMEFFGVKADALPAIVTVDMSSGSNMMKFFFDGEISQESVSQHVKAFFAGELKPTLKSEEVSVEDTKNAVKVIKGKSFEDMVLNNDNDVLVEFYAPWVGCHLDSYRILSFRLVRPLQEIGTCLRRVGQ